MKTEGWRRVPLAVWIVVAVAAIHVAFFWAVSDKHFLPKARYVPPAPTPNFGVGQHRSVDRKPARPRPNSSFR